MGAGQGIQNIVNQNQGNLSALSGQLSGSIIPGIQNQIAQTGKQLQPGFGYLNRTLGSGFLQTGQDQAKALGDYAGQQAGNAVNSAFSMAGRTGSDNHATDLARGVTQAQLAPMLQNLQYNEGIQNQAAGMLPGYTSAQYQGYQPLLGATQLAGQLPYYGANALGNIGGLFNGYGTQTGTQPGGWGTGLLGAAANMFSFAPISLSDVRLKMNVERIGDWDERGDGLGKYQWNWRADPNGEKVTGVLAHEVKELRPQAYAPNFRGDGYDGVNYAALGDLS